MIGEQVIIDGDKSYPLRLTFAATKKIEQSIGKSIIRLDPLAIWEVAVALSASGGMSEEEAFDIIRRVGIEIISVQIRMLILETFNPEKKKEAAANPQQS